MFRKITLLMLTIVSLNANAQFTIDDDTLYAYGAAGLNSNEYIDIFGKTVIRNTNSQTQAIVWTRMNVNLPDPIWETAICDIIYCRTPEVGTDSFTFNAGVDTGILSFHFYTKNVSGTGSFTVRFSKKDNPLDYKDVVIIATAWDPVSIKRLSSANTVLYPNPAKTEIRIENALVGTGTLRITNVLGQLVMELPFTNNQFLNIESLESGIYTINILGENGISSSQFIKE